MDIAKIENLPLAQTLALAYLKHGMKEKLATAFALDLRLSRIVGGASEPMLAQMRLTWWRDMLEKPITERPKGDLVLFSISENWMGEETILNELVDAWEEFLLVEMLDRVSAERIATRRGAFIAATMHQPGGYSNEEGAKLISTRWALADLAAHCSNESERELLVEVADSLAGGIAPLPRNLRGFAVLNALSKHALKQGGRPLAQGRSGALIAFRAGLLGK